MSYVHEFAGETEEQARADRERIAHERQQRLADTQAEQARREIERVAQEQASLEVRVRAAFPGTEAQWQAEKEDLLRAERARVTAAQAGAAQRLNAQRYVD